VELKSLLFLVALAVILLGLPLSTISDSSAPLADSNIPDNEVATNQAEANNSSASATITITMYAMVDECPKL